MDFVILATSNANHHELALAFLEAVLRSHISEEKWTQVERVEWIRDEVSSHLLWVVVDAKPIASTKEPRF